MAEDFRTPRELEMLARRQATSGSSPQPLSPQRLAELIQTPQPAPPPQPDPSPPTPSPAQWPGQLPLNPQAQRPSSFQLPGAPASQPLSMPPTPAGLNLAGMGNVPPGMPAAPTQVPFSQMPVFQGFPGPFPGEAGPSPGTGAGASTNQADLVKQRAIASIAGLKLPPDVMARLVASVNNQPPPGAGNDGGTGDTGTGGSGPAVNAAGIHGGMSPQEQMAAYRQWEAAGKPGASTLNQPQQWDGFSGMWRQTNFPQNPDRGH